MHRQDPPLPLGKLPPALLERLLAGAPQDASVLLGPGTGRDCAVVECGGDTLLVLKSDPITFVTEDLGRYLVQINVNDLATTGAEPRWLLVTLLLPESSARASLVESILGQIYATAAELGISVVGGHTEVTHGLAAPIAVGMLVGTVARERLITPRGARPGDRLLLTKGVPIEAVSVLARSFPERLAAVLDAQTLAQARDYLSDPGISVLQDARIAQAHGHISAMHDPTEGGLAAALWELASACGHGLVADPAAVPVPGLARRVCDAFAIDPLASIASGALLLTVGADDAPAVRHALVDQGIPCADIGSVTDGAPEVRDPAGAPWPWPERDGVARVFEAQPRSE